MDGQDSGAIIMQREYTNQYGKAVAPTSTIAAIEVSHAGIGGGTMSLSLDVAGGDRLDIWDDVNFSEKPLQLPVSWKVSFEDKRLFYAKGKCHSVQKGDVCLKISFEDEDGYLLSTNLTLTVLEMYTETCAAAPDNSSRRELGVGEYVYLQCEPKVSGVSVLGVDYEVDDCRWEFHASANRGEQDVSLSYMGSVSTMKFNIFEPKMIEGVGARMLQNGSYWRYAGNFEALITFVVQPTNVSFVGVSIMELGGVATNAVDYFRRSDMADCLIHKTAGYWHGLENGNIQTDRVVMKALPAPWGDNGGSFTWPIPNVWRVTDGDCVTNMFPHMRQYDQRFELESNGTARIIKLGYIVETHTNGTYTCKREMP